MTHDFEGGTVLQPAVADEVPLVRWVRSQHKLLLGFAVVAAVFWCLIYAQFTVDDAYISFRYGKTLVDHHVWNWNPGGPPTEAYTSFLYTVLSILPALLHISAALFFKIVGLACSAWVFYRLMQVRRDNTSLVLCALAFGLSPYFWELTFGGLETPLYMLLLVEMWLCVRDAPRVSAAYVYLLFLLLPLTRPEGVIFGLVGVGLFWYRRGERSKQIGYFVAAILAGLAYFVIRWRYFHLLLPNPFYAKVVHASLSDLSRHISTNIHEHLVYFIALVLVVCITRQGYLRVVALLTIGLLLVLYTPHEMLMDYADRYYFQVAFPVVVCCLALDAFEGAPAISFLLSLILLSGSTAGRVFYGVNYYPYLVGAHIDLAKRLAPYAEGHTMMVGDAGALPYYSDWQGYDFLGLVTHFSAQNPLNVAWLNKTEPDLVIVYVNRDGALDGEETVVPWIKASKDYQYAGASHWSYFDMAIFVKNGIAQHDEIVQAIKANEASSRQVKLSIKDLLLQRYLPLQP